MTAVHIVPILQDNYVYIVVGDDGYIGIVDPGEAADVIDFLDTHNLKPDCILNTHHHWDHINGIADLLKRFPTLKIFTPEDRATSFGNQPLEIIETPGHTLDHISYYLPESGVLFSGDTLFSMGCGKLFEGTAEQMWESLSKLMALPDETLIYCGHEYTQSNGVFCQQIEPDNEALKKRMEEVASLRKDGRPTLPVTMAQEKETNVFLRAGSAIAFRALREFKG